MIGFFNIEQMLAITLPFISGAQAHFDEQVGVWLGAGGAVLLSMVGTAYVCYLCCTRKQAEPTSFAVTPPTQNNLNQPYAIRSTNTPQHSTVENDYVISDNDHYGFEEVAGPALHARQYAPTSQTQPSQKQVKQGVGLEKTVVRGLPPRSKYPEPAISIEDTQNSMVEPAIDYIEGPVDSNTYSVVQPRSKTKTLGFENASYEEGI